ncbi:hypothetical protein AAC387_Pa11g0516 [Persea americana]
MKSAPASSSSSAAAAAEEEEQHEEEQELDFPNEETSDLCERLLQRYKKSSASQHRHLCASAAAIRSILQEEQLPLTPHAYFAATISSIHDATTTAGTLDPDSVSALSSFLSILLPLVPPESLSSRKSTDAASVLAGLLRGRNDKLSAATVRSVVKSIGFLAPLCGGEDWGAVELPLKLLLEFSVDRRPKVRRCAQMCLEKAFKSFGSVVLKKASKLVLSMFQGYIPLASELSAIKIVDGSKNETLSSPKHLEVLHMLNALKLILPILSQKVVSKLLSELYKLLGCHFSPLTRHSLNILQVVFESSRSEVLVSEAENIVASLISYVSLSDKNPIDTIISALSLLKCCLDKLHSADRSIWVKNLPPVFNLVAGFLNSDDYIAIQARDILKGMINHHFDRSIFLTSGNQLCDAAMNTSESTALESICAEFVNLLNACDSIPNEHTLAVISDLFLKLGDISQIFMKCIVHKLSEMMVVGEDMPGMKHLQQCIGSAVVAMGPENILSMIPISLHSEKRTCSNTWLIPILKKYVVGSSLEYFMEHIAPLAKSIQSASHRAKKTTMVRELQTCAHGLWNLLPSFCQYPIDTSQRFEPFANLLVVLLKDSFMHETIAAALQELVNQNRRIIRGNLYANEIQNLPISLESVAFPSHYSKKIASRNIKALASSSMDLIQALTGVFFNSPPEKRPHLKEAIGCLASITESSKVKDFFTSLEKFQVIDGVTESEKLEADVPTSINSEQGRRTNKKERVDSRRCLIIDLASSLVEGADEDLINIIYDYIRPPLQATHGNGQSEALYTLSRIFKEHAWFYSARFDELIDLLLGQKALVCNFSQRSRLTCLHFLLVDLLKSDMEENNVIAFRILNEIILTLKDPKKEFRSAAYDTLLMISSSLKNLPSVDSDAPLHRLFSMIMGYLSGASPHIMSGAVAALSVLIYKDPSLCTSVPELMPSVLVLLQSKANEVIKAALGFVKVLVSCLQAKELQKFLADVVNGVLPWSSVSKNHFRLKVRIIMEIVIRKCGSDSVELVMPEKYMGFFKSVVEQRHSKTSSKEADGSDPELKLADSSLKGARKRKRNELGTSRGENVHRGFDTSRREKKRRMTTKGNPVRGHESQSQKKARPFSEKKKRKGIHESPPSGGKGMNQGWKKDSKRHKSEAGAFSKSQKRGRARKLKQRFK